MNRKWKAPKDSLDEGDAVLDVLDIRVGRTMSVDDFVEAGQGRIQISTVRRAGRTTIVDPDRPLEAGDVVTVVAAHSVVDELVKAVGTRVRRRWPQDRNIAVSRFTVSDDELVGRPISELNLHDRLGSTITRVRRLDTRMVATADTYLELGDVVEVAHPANRQEAVTSYFGDSRRSISEVDLVALAGGLTLGYLAALVVIPLPAGASFALGSAAGPLIVGLVLGALQKSRLDINWKLPGSANFTLRQFGLMIFLAAVGISSGPAFASTALSMTGLLSVALGAVVTVVTLLAFFALMRVLGQSIPRASGGAAGIMSQPAVLQFATSRLTDSRVMNGYSTVVTLAVITKIVMVPLMLIII
ncbi:TrkA C-terminal domain-containing protein [Luteococcus sp. OSA5]|uniref:aspartate-alanine antiporter-like transporter n=1 Tax=Luteococcus sp. OSA5 TaxID=3401630 RepID=UPI003B429439